MQRSFRSILIASAVLGVPQLASASLLVGFHNFSGGTSESATPEDPTNYAMTGFSGTATNAAGSLATVGSSDKFYGDSKSYGTGDDGVGGSALASHSKSLVVTALNGTGVSYNIDTLLFDAATLTAVKGGVVYYKIGSGTYTPLSSYTVGEAEINGGALSSDYQDFSMYLDSIVLPSGQSISFEFTPNTSSGVQRFDNIGIVGSLTPVPEPGSLVALGCLVGSGAFLRTRRRSAAPQLG